MGAEDTGGAAEGVPRRAETVSGGDASMLPGGVTFGVRAMVVVLVAGTLLLLALSALGGGGDARVDTAAGTVAGPGTTADARTEQRDGAAVGRDDPTAPVGGDPTAAPSMATTTSVAGPTTSAGAVPSSTVPSAPVLPSTTSTTVLTSPGPSSSSTSTTVTTVPAPVIPGLPWQLGATADEVAYTEDLIRRTHAAVAEVPSIAAAEAMGYVRINRDHLLKPKLLGDDKNLDPTAIESYIVATRDGVDYIAGAMYVLDLGKTMADVPDVGPLITWHDHGGFCFDASAVIVGTDPVTGACPEGSVFIADPPMTHLWSEPLTNADGSVRTAEACGTFRFFDLPHHGSVPGCGSPLDEHAH